MVWNKEALVQDCAAWMEASKDAQSETERKDLMLESIRRLSNSGTRYFDTHVQSDRVVIVVAQREAATAGVSLGPAFTFYWLEVFPLRRNDPDYSPTPSSPDFNATLHPRIFKVREYVDFDD